MKPSALVEPVGAEVVRACPEVGAVIATRLGRNQKGIDEFAADAFAPAAAEDVHQRDKAESGNRWSCTALAASLPGDRHADDRVDIGGDEEECIGFAQVGADLRFAFRRWGAAATACGAGGEPDADGGVEIRSEAGSDDDRVHRNRALLSDDQAEDRTWSMGAVPSDVRCVYFE